MGLAKKRRHVRRRKKNLLMRMGSLCFICYVASMLIGLQADIAEGRRKLEELNRSCEEQRLANKEVERLLQLGDDDDYIERVARAKSGYAYPDERIFYPITGKR